jgi:hypothetical protein
VEENGRKEWLLLGFGNFLNHLSGCARGVNAEWLFSEKVSGGGEGAGATTHTDVTEFAAAALPFQVIVITKFVEDHGVRPDIGKALLAQVTSERGQITAGENLALMGDKANACARQAAFGHGVHITGMSAWMASVTDGRTAAGLERNSS